MNEVATRTVGSALAIRPEQGDWTPEQGQALLEMFNLGAAPLPVIRSYFHICQTTGLDPFKRQIHLIERQGKFTPQTSIDGFRIIRDRSKVYDGDETFWCGEDGAWVDAWLRSEPPTACKFVLYVKGRSKPVTAVARWSEYVQTKRDGSVTSMWSRMSAHMLAKVAEALAIRKAFPDDTGGLYTDDEMMQADVIHDDGSASPRGGRERSPGLLDVGLEVPPEPRREEPPQSGGVGSFMDDPGVEDAVLVEDEPVSPPEAHATGSSAPVDAEPVREAEPAAEKPGEEPGALLDAAPEPRREIELVWSKRLVDFCEGENPQLHVLKALYDECSAAGALSDRVPWAGDPRTGGWTVHDAIMAVKANLEAGRAPLVGVA